MDPLRTTLDAQPSSVQQARRFVREALRTLDASAATDDAEVLVSELATNAVLHARTSFTVEVTRDGGTVRVRVRDLSAAVPRQRAYGTDASTGRGIRLVATLAQDWGVDPEDTGKAVWFDLPADGRGALVGSWDDSDEADVCALLAGYDDDSSSDVVALGRVA